MNSDTLITELIGDEGLKLRPYFDCCGKYYRDCTCPTKGYLTIGIGHNLDNGISEYAARSICLEDVAIACRDLDSHLPWWRNLTENRQLVLSNMAFNMGIKRLIGFVKMLHAAETGDYETAAVEMLASAWAGQVKGRSARLAVMMRNG